MDDLGHRLWEQFEEILKNQKGKKIISQLKINSDEVNVLHSIALSFTTGDIIPNRNKISKYWKNDGLIYLLLFTFTKYIYQPDKRFWEEWKLWTKADTSSDLCNPKIYYYIENFSNKHSLFLYKLHRNEYVGSLKTQAFIGLWTLKRLLETLFFMALQYPYHLDQNDRDSYLYEILDQAGQEPSGEIEKEDDLEMASFQFRKSFRLAAYLQKEIAYKELVQVFKDLHEIVLSLVGERKRRNKGLIYLEPYIQDCIDNFESSIQLGQYETLINESIQESKEKRKIFRRPGIYLDTETLYLTLHVPEQRIFNDDVRSIYRVLVNYVLNKEERKLNFRFFNDIPYFTRSEDITLFTYTGQLIWEIFKNHTLIKANTIKEPVLLFQLNGNRIELPINQEQDIYILLPEKCDFECDNASINNVPNTNYSIALVNCNKETLLYINGSFISPFAQDIPRLTENKNKVIYESVKILDSQDETNPVYREFPSFSVRAKSERELRDLYPLYINNKEINYIITQRKPLCDGSDNFIYSIIIPDNEKKHSGIGLYDLKIGNPILYSKKVFIITNLTFSFTEPLFFNEKHIRVENLSFDLFESICPASYFFPMKDNNCKFKIKIIDEVYRIVLQPPLIKCLLDDQELQDIEWCDDVIDKNLCIISEIEHLQVFLQYPDKTMRVLYPSKSGNKRIYLLNSLDQDKLLRSDPVHIVVKSNNQEKIITTIYFKFSFIEEPRFHCKEEGYLNSSIIKDDGLYLIGKTIGSKNENYQGILIYKATGQEYKFSIKPNSTIAQTFFITDDYVVNGNSSLSIRRSKKTIGQSKIQEIIDYEKDFKKLYEDPEEEENLYSLEIGSLLEVENSDGGTINNFFLKIDDELCNDDGFLANGYFLINQNDIQHTEFNPYTITNISIEGNTVECNITDKDGRPPNIDQRGRVNPLSGVNFTQIKKIYAKLINEEDATYDF